MPKTMSNFIAEHKIDCNYKAKLQDFLKDNGFKLIYTPDTYTWGRVTVMAVMSEDVRNYGVENCVEYAVVISIENDIPTRILRCSQVAR